MAFPLITKLTIATRDTKKMAQFYTTVFGARLQEIDAGEAILHAGFLGGVQVLFCPQEMAGITATENNIQLCLQVEDIAGTFAAVEPSGGTIIQEPSEMDESMMGALRDPDGNSLEVFQK